MSLLNAKKIADLKEAIELKSKIFSMRQDGIRKSINDELVSGFSTSMESQGFEVRKSELVVIAAYKGLSVQLKLIDPEDRLVAVYHSFDIMVGDKVYFVRVVPEWSGAAMSYPEPGNTVKGLESILHRIEYEIENKKLISFKLVFARDGAKKQASRQHVAGLEVRVDNVSELIEHVLAQ